MASLEWEYALGHLKIRAIYEKWHASCFANVGWNNALSLSGSRLYVSSLFSDHQCCMSVMSCMSIFISCFEHVRFCVNVCLSMCVVANNTNHCVHSMGGIWKC